MPGLKERIARHLPDHPEMEGEPLVMGARTITGELPADGGMHYLSKAKDAVAGRLPDYTAEYGGQPLVSPGTRSITGEVRSATTPQLEIEGSEDSRVLPVGEVAVGELLADNPVLSSAEVESHAASQGNVAVIEQPPEQQ